MYLNSYTAPTSQVLPNFTLLVTARRRLTKRDPLRGSFMRVGWRALCGDRARRTHKRVVKWEVCLCPQNPRRDRACETHKRVAKCDFDCCWSNPLRRWYMLDAQTCGDMHIFCCAARCRLFTRNEDLTAKSEVKMRNHVADKGPLWQGFSV